MGLFQPFSIALSRSEDSMGGIRNDFRSVCSIGDDVNEANDPELGNFVTDPVGSKGCRLLLCIYFFSTLFFDGTFTESGETETCLNWLGIGIRLSSNGGVLNFSIS